MESRKKLTLAEFDENIRNIFTKHGISRKSNFLAFLMYVATCDIAPADVDAIIAGKYDCTLDEEVQKFKIPLFDFIKHEELRRLLSRADDLTLERDQKTRSSSSDITRRHKCVYIGVEMNIPSMYADIEKVIATVHPDILAKFKRASDALFLQEAIELVDAAFKPFDDAAVTHVPPAGSDLDNVLLLVNAMRTCFDQLPDKFTCELSADELLIRHKKFEALIHRLSPYAENTHPFASSNTEEFRWLVTLKQAGAFYKDHCASGRIEEALRFQQALSDYLSAHGVKASEQENIFGELLCGGEKFQTFTNAYFFYQPMDPTHIYLTFHLMDDEGYVAVREHLQALDEKNRMEVIEVGIPKKNAGFYEVKVKSSDALNILLPKFKELFEKKVKENPAEIVAYQGVESPKPPRRCAIAFFDPKSLETKQQLAAIKKRGFGK